ncbi:alpha/beta fold hydrolase [Peribacillus sp. SCS-37]|uniref:alpha/beta fold hydrolase n=1 Tax=Paraperibacillus esterisolvens TaxID=3115296 RepID=UPI003906AAAB
MAKLKVGTENEAPIEIYYEDHGSGQPIILVHGWPLSRRSWEYQVPALVEEGFRVITYDRRGFGSSSQPYGGYDYDTLAGDLNELIEHLDLKDAVLVGFSMGGGEVVRYIGNYGSDRISKAVLAAAVPPYLYKSDDNPEGGLDDKTISELENGVRTDRLSFLDDFTIKFFSPDGAQILVSEPLRKYNWQIAANASPKATLECISAFSRTDFRADLEKIDVPVFIIHGDSDSIVPFEVSGKRSHESIQNSELQIISGGPHGINATHPQEFNEALISFLKS